MTELKHAIERSSGTLFGDFFGAAALVVMFLVALHLPGLV